METYKRILANGNAFVIYFLDISASDFFMSSVSFFSRLVET